MELKLQTREERFLRPILAEEMQQEETAEALIPESSPDAERLLGCYATPIVRSKTCRDGNLTVSGGIRTDILYAAQDGSVHRVETYLPFTARLDRDRIRETVTVQIRCAVQSADARLLNPRRLVVRVGVRTAMRIYAETVESFPILEPEDAQVQVRQANIAVVWPVTAAERVFTIHDVLDLPAGRPPIAQLLNCQYHLRVTDGRMIGNKAVWKGAAEVRVLYLDEKGELYSWLAEVPYSQYMELEREADDDGLRVVPFLTDAECTTTENGVEIELNVAAQCLCLARQELTVTEDAYCLHDRLTPSRKEVSLPSRLDTQLLRKTVRGQMSCSFENAIDVELYPGKPEMTREGESVTIRTPMQASVLYLNREHQPESRIVKLECSFESVLAPQASCQAEVEADGAFYAAAAADGAEIRGQLCCTVVSDAEQAVSFLDGAAVEPGEKQSGRPSVVLRAAEEEESLWEIAKACGSTVAAIREANALKEEELEAGQLLLIPTA